MSDEPMAGAASHWITALGARWYQRQAHHDPDIDPDALLQQTRAADHLLKGRSLLSAAVVAPWGSHPIEARPKFLETIRGELERIRLQHRLLQPVVAVQVEQAIHYHGFLYPYDPAARRVHGFYEQHRPFDRHMSKCPSAIADLQAMVDQSLPIPQHGQRALVLGSCGSRNYGHWLLDDLSRLYLYLTHLGAGGDRTIRPPRRIVLPAFNPLIDERRTQAARWLMEACSNRSMLLRPRAAGQQTRVVLQPNRRCYMVREATLVSPASRHPYELHPGAMLGLKQAAQRTLAGQPADGPRPKRVFISRRNNRTVLNLDGLEDLLGRFGFSTAYCEDLDFDGQRNLFAGADLVIGIMGAAMCNLIFAPEHCRVLFLAPEGWLDPLFHILMASMHMEARFIYCPVQVDGDDAPSRSGQLSVPLASVQTWLEDTTARSSASS
jgi:hypothetical protein